MVIGIHPFVVGTPNGAAAMRRVLLRLNSDDKVWLTDTDAIRNAGFLLRDPEPERASAASSST